MFFSNTELSQQYQLSHRGMKKKNQLSIQNLPSTQYASFHSKAPSIILTNREKDKITMLPEVRTDRDNFKLEKTKSKMLSLLKPVQQDNINPNRPSIGSYIEQKTPAQQSKIKEYSEDKSRELISLNELETQLDVLPQPKRLRKINSLKKLRRQWHSIEKQSEDILHRSKFDLELNDVTKIDLLKRLINTFQFSISVVDKAISQPMDSVVIDYKLEALKPAILMLRSLEVKETYVRLLMIEAKTKIDIGDVYEGVKLFKEGKKICHRSGNLPFKMRIYKLLGSSYLLIQEYQQALNAFLKMINLAWYLGNSDYELLAYEKLALTFYYLGKAVAVRVLHSRQLDARLEPDDSSTKMFGVSRIKMRLKLLAAEKKSKEILTDSSSEEDDQYIQEMIEREELKLRTTAEHLLKPRDLYQLKKFKGRIAPLLTHRSYNRDKSNYLIFSTQDLVHKKMKDNSDFIFVWTTKIFQKYQNRLKKFRQMLKILLTAFQKQLNSITDFNNDQWPRRNGIKQ